MLNEELIVPPFIPFLFIVYSFSIIMLKNTKIYSKNKIDHYNFTWEWNPRWYREE